MCKHSLSNLDWVIHGFLQKAKNMRSKACLDEKKRKWDAELEKDPKLAADEEAKKKVFQARYVFFFFLLFEIQSIKS